MIGILRIILGLGVDMSEYTKGMWGYRVKNGANAVCSSNRRICKLFGKDKESLANGNLIAAAPDMLEALEAIESITDIWLPNEIAEEHIHEAVALHQVREMYLRAIAKAKGESQ